MPESAFDRCKFANNLAVVRNGELMDKLRSLKFFCRVVEVKSFASAAHALNVPPSVVSRVISALEADLKCALFNRSTRKLALTEGGAAYYGRCRQLLIELEESDSLARQGSTQPTGTLRIGCHPAFRMVLGRGLGSFRIANPEVDVELVVTNAPASLLNEGLDVVLMVGRVADSSFVATQLGWTSLITCAAPNYLDRRGRPREPRDLRDHAAVIPGRRDEDPFTRWTFAKQAKRQTVVLPVAVVVRDGVGLTDAAIGQAGVAQIYDISARPHLKNKELEQLLVDWSSKRQPIYAVFPSRRNVPAKVRVFMAFARRLLLDHGKSEGDP